jgi:hypothetical protein
MAFLSLIFQDTELDISLSPMQEQKKNRVLKHDLYSKMVKLMMTMMKIRTTLI